MKNYQTKNDKYPEDFVKSLFKDTVYEYNDNVDYIQNIELAIKHMNISPTYEGVFYGRFVNKAKYEDIGKLYGFGRERAQQIVQKIVNDLNTHFYLETIAHGVYPGVDETSGKVSLDAPIAVLQLKTRALNILIKNNIQTVRELVEYLQEPLKPIKGLGITTAQYLVDIVNEVVKPQQLSNIIEITKGKGGYVGTHLASEPDTSPRIAKISE